MGEGMDLDVTPAEQVRHWDDVSDRYSPAGQNKTSHGKNLDEYSNAAEHDDRLEK